MRKKANKKAADDAKRKEEEEAEAQKKAAEEEAKADRALRLKEAIGVQRAGRARKSPQMKKKLPASPQRPQSQGSEECEEDSDSDEPPASSGSDGNRVLEEDASIECRTSPALCSNSSAANGRREVRAEATTIARSPRSSPAQVQCRTQEKCLGL